MKILYIKQEDKVGIILFVCQTDQQTSRRFAKYPDFALVCEV